MIRCTGGYKILRTQCLADRISYRLDSEISPPYPKSWSTRLFTKTFSENFKKLARVQGS